MSHPLISLLAITACLTISSLGQAQETKSPVVTTHSQGLYGGHATLRTTKAPGQITAVYKLKRPCFMGGTVKVTKALRFREDAQGRLNGKFTHLSHNERIVVKERRTKFGAAIRTIRVTMPHYDQLRRSESGWPLGSDWSLNGLIGDGKGNPVGKVDHIIAERTYRVAAGKETLLSETFWRAPGGKGKPQKMSFVSDHTRRALDEIINSEAESPVFGGLTAKSSLTTIVDRVNEAQK